MERLFGNITTITHARNCDSLELCQRLSHAEYIEAIITKHPTWKRIHGRRLCGNKDYLRWSGLGNLEIEELLQDGGGYESETIFIKLVAALFTKQQ